MIRPTVLAIALLAAAGLAQGSARAAEQRPLTPADAALAHPTLWPQAHSPQSFTDARTEAFITALMAKMTLEEKVGQTIQADIASITPEDLRRYPIGALLAGGNSSPGGDEWAPPAKWVEMIEAFRHAAAQRSQIPLIFGIDAVHGHNNVVGATIFPHNIGLGAARDPDLIRRIGQATAEEVAATGADWTFGPTVTVPRDVRWGRSYEGYGADPEIVKSYAGQMTLGLQGELRPGRPIDRDRIVGAAKHFLADGGTLDGKDQGDAKISEQELISLHAQGYPPAIDAGILSVLVSFSSWNGQKFAANRSVLTDVLKGRMGFQGLVVDDWNAHGEVPGCTNTDCPQAMNAGLDMFMAPDSWKGLYENTLAEVKSGVIPTARLDDAVRRILRVKVKAGLFEGPRPIEGHFERLGAPDHRALAREAVRKSLVLLKNDGGLLPLRPSAHVLVAGDGADDIGKQSGGWTITWQGTGNRNKDFPNGQSIWGAISDTVRAGGGQAELATDGRFKTRPDVAIVVFGEDPYAEFQGDIQSVAYKPGDPRDLELLLSLKRQGIPVVAVFLSGRPLFVNPEINASEAFVAAWLPGTEAAGLTDVLFRKADGAVNFDFHGKLSFPWPRRADQAPLDPGLPDYDPQFPYGFGLTYADHVATPVLSENPGRAALGPNVGTYFAAGRARPPFSLSTTGQVSLRAIDGDTQENAQLAVWSGPGNLAVSGPRLDLTRQATGDMALFVRYRLDHPPGGPVILSMTCGPGCGAGVDISPYLAKGATGEWRTLKVRLACLKAKGVQMDQVISPLQLEATAPFALAFTDLRLDYNQGDAVCPA